MPWKRKGVLFNDKRKSSDKEVAFLSSLPVTCFAAVLIGFRAAGS